MENRDNQQNNGQGFAIASLIIGIFAILFSIIPCVGTSAIIIGTVAVVFGTVALTKASASQSPKGLSIAGITLGGSAIVIAIIWLTVIVSAKSFFKDHFQNRFENFTEWADNGDQINTDDNYEDFDKTESLENLEKALDELEGVIDETNSDINDTVTKIHKETKEAIKVIREDIEDAKSQKQ